MILTFLSWLGKNLSTLVTAFILALVVWVSAVTSADPNQQLTYPRPVPIEQRNLNPELLIVGDINNTVQVVLNAPKSVWNELSGDQNAVRAWIDLSNLGPGVHTVPVQVQPDRRLGPAQVVSKDPASIRLTLEPLVTKTVTVTIVVNGEPALGYQAGAPQADPDRVIVSGAASKVSQVNMVRAVVDITNASQNLDASTPLQALDLNEQPVQDVTLTPDTVKVKEPVTLLGGYRNVIVKVITTGQIADGYRLTNIQVSPPNVIVFSSDPQLLNSLPGYIETKPLDLNGAQDDFETPVELNLPQGISIIKDQKVLVQVSIAAIDTSMTISLPVDYINLDPGLSAAISPVSANVILSGPMPVLANLKPTDIRVVVDLSGKGPGSYQLAPSVAFLPSRVAADSILPATVQVVIVQMPTPTPTGTPGPGTPTPTNKP